MEKIIMEKIIIYFALFVSIVPTIFASSSVFPDYSSHTELELQQQAKKGVVSVCLGFGCEAAAQYLPKIHGQTQSENIFSSKTVEGFGKVMIINGGKELVFASKELYERYVRQLPEITRGTADLAAAFTFYYLPSCIPKFLNDPYIELGGQGAAILLYSYLGLRGFFTLTKGLNNYFVKKDWSYTPEYLKGYMSDLWPKTHRD